MNFFFDLFSSRRTDQTFFLSRIISQRFHNCFNNLLLKHSQFVVAQQKQ